MMRAYSEKLATVELSFQHLQRSTNRGNKAEKIRYPVSLGFGTRFRIEAGRYPNFLTTKVNKSSAVAEMGDRARAKWAEK